MASKTPIRFASLGFLLVLLLLTGCSGISLFYNQAGFFIEQYADDYLTLDKKQSASWKQPLARALARHRREELPHLAALFNALHSAARAGFNADGTACLLDAFEDLYRRHFRWAAEPTAPLLVSLRPHQIRALEHRFAQDAQEEVDKSQDPKRRLRKRAERWSEQIEWWIGPLSGEQLRIVREVSAGMPDTTDWAAYRSARQAELIRLLDRKAGKAEVRDYLTAWLAYHRDLPTSLHTAKQGFRRQMIDLFVRLDASFSRTQRDHFAERLDGLRDAFMDLQAKPRMAALKCP